MVSHKIVNKFLIFVILIFRGLNPTFGQFTFCMDHQVKYIL